MAHHHFSIGLVLLLAACAKPTLLREGEARYAVQALPAQTFVYLEYRFEGGSFDDAVLLEHRFADWGKKHGVLASAMGRFPTLRDWQLGFISTGALPATTFEDHTIHSMELPAGDWARVRTEGHLESMFWHWNKPKRWAKKDGREVRGAVVEEYPDIFTDQPADEQSGAIRWPLEDPTPKDDQPPT